MEDNSLDILIKKNYKEILAAVFDLICLFFCPLTISALLCFACICLFVCVCVCVCSYLLMSLSPNTLTTSTKKKKESSVLVTVFFLP